MSNTPTPVSEDRIPVIVGVGEITDRPKEIADGLEPLALSGARLEPSGTSPAAMLRDACHRTALRTDPLASSSA